MPTSALWITFRISKRSVDIGCDFTGLERGSVEPFLRVRPILLVVENRERERFGLAFRIAPL
jgi:hypothetical protein